MFRNLNLTTKLMFTFVPLFVVLIADSYIVNNRAQEAAMLDQAKISAIQRAQIVKEALVAQMVDKYKVDDKFLERLQHVGGLNDLYIRIKVDNLRLLEDLVDSTRSERLAKRMQYAIAKGSIGDQVFEMGNAIFLEKENELEAIVPFKAEKKCLACHEVRVGDVLGAAHISVPLVSIKEAIDENSQRLAISTAGFALLLLIVSYFLFRSLIQKPIRSLLIATEALERGNLNHEIPIAKSNDELGILSKSFDKMRRALKQSQEALRTSMVGQVATSLMRDFRAPMRQILDAIQQIEKETLPEEQKSVQAEKARSAVATMNKMAQDLLDFTAGDLKVNIQPCNIQSVINYVGDSVKQDLERDLIKLELHHGFQGTAPLDYERTTRALINIVAYSANYVPPDGIIRIETERREASLSISISGNGSTIPVQFRDRIFEPFVKIVQEKGVGLSLALAKRVVEVQGGTCEVESVEGKGNTFRIRLPLNS